jgi:hypothetical protein
MLQFKVEEIHLSQMSKETILVFYTIQNKKIDLKTKK